MKKQLLLIPLALVITLVSCKKEPDTNTTNAYTTNNYTTVDEFDIKASKMEKASSVFDAIASQPEMAGPLIQTTALLYSDYTVLLPLSDKAIVQRGKARGIGFGLLFMAIARQPEASPILDSAAAKFLGKYDPSYISNDLLEITQTYAIDGLNQSLARQPEVDSVLNLISIKYLNLDINARK
ncbi:MAG: hypothetical protein WCP69_09940 [Bacteroidota bacterium]